MVHTYIHVIIITFYMLYIQEVALYSQFVLELNIIWKAANNVIN